MKIVKTCRKQPELSQETIEAIERARERIRKGKFVSEDDLEFSRRTEEAFKRYEKGEFTRMDFDKFIKKLKKF